jgi:hypothetical protein
MKTLALAPSVERAATSSANSAAFISAWGQRPRTIEPPTNPALKARFTQGVASIPHITFVIVDAVLAQELAIFFLKGVGA